MSAPQDVGLQYLVKFRNGQDYKQVADEGGVVPVIGSGGPFTTANDFLYDGESVLFGRKGTVDRPRHIVGKFWTVDTMFYTELSESVHGRWLYYWATTVPYGLYSTDTALPSMTSSTLGRLKVPWVPFDAQKRIADYLDRETGEIDAMLAKMDELTTTLEARRTEVVQTVLRELPERVSVTLLAETVSGSGFPDRFQGVTDAELPFYKVSSLSTARQGVLYEAENTVTSATAESLGARIIPAGSIVMAKIGAALLLARFVRTSVRCCIDNNMQALVPRAEIVHSRFLAYAMKTVSVPSLVKPGPVPTIDVMGLKMTQIPIARDLDEQQRIADHLDEVTGKIDQMLAKTAELKSLLIERRSALITDVVTGKKQVHS